MAKKTKSAPGSPAKPVDEAALSSLKEEGNQLFARKDYDKALETYDRALRLVAPDTPDAALLHSNKAACHMMFKKFKEAVNECTAALDSQPTFFKALVRRGKAYEQMGLFKQALTDFQRANKLDTATTESREAEKRLRDIVTGKRSGAANGAKKAVPTKAPVSGRQVAFPAKLSLDDDTRVLHLVPGVTYLELMEHVKQLYPAAGPFVLKFLDKEGDLVTITSRADLQRAMQEAVEAAQKGAGPRLPVTQNSLPPIRLQVVRVASEDEVPKIPEEELAYMQHMLAQLQKAQAAQAAERAAADAAAGGAAGADDAAAQQQLQIDEWILSFVDLLKEHCGLDPDRPIECNEVGSEKLNAAFSEMMENDPRADELLGQAYDKFEDQVCLGMYNQATVHQARAELLISKAAKSGAGAAGIVADVEKHLQLAEAKFDEALAYKASFLDGYLGKSHLAQLRGKLAAGYLVEVARPREDIKDTKERAAAEEAANRAHIKAAFARVAAGDAKKAEAHFDASYQLIQRAMDSMTEEDRAKEIKPMRPTAEQSPSDPDHEVVLKSTLLITLGNAHYEHSIVRAAGGLDWRPLVEAAAAKFREAGAHEVDIRNALKGHPLAEELADLIGPEPEPAKAEEGKEEGKQGGEAAAPKGLPALPKQGKKKDAAAA